MTIKVSEACDLWIKEQIEDGLSMGKPYTVIGQEISQQILKYFEVYVEPGTIKQRARRTSRKGTNVPPENVTPDDDSDIKTKKPGKGSPTKPRKYPAQPPKPVFNETNENIEWAKWTWNPVTGCLHGCDYCYARDIANRFYKEKFKPTFYAHRLDAPFNTKLPNAHNNGYRNVFVCSMADLFGEWVKQDWIDKIMKVVGETPQWNYLFLTKNPKRLLTIEWPQNAWVGTTVDVQKRVEQSIDVFSKLVAPVKFLSCEPLLEKIDYVDMSMFDWLIVGAKSFQGRWEQPEWAWVENLFRQARKDKLKVYFKPNLTIRPKEYPTISYE